MDTSRSREDEHEGKNHAEKDHAQKNHAAAAPRPPVKRRRRWLRRAGLAALVLVVLLLGLRTYLYVDYVLALRAYRAAGYPTTWEELAAQQMPLNDAHNAATLVRKAASAVVRAAHEDWELLPGFDSLPVTRMSDDQAAAVDRYLADNDNALSLLAEAMSEPALRFDLSSVRSGAQWEGAVPVAGLHSLAGVVAIHGLALAHRDRLREAADCVVTIARLGVSLAAQPGDVAHLIEMSIEDTARELGFYLLRGWRLDAAALDAVSMELPRADDDARLHLAWEGQAVFSLESVHERAWYEEAGQRKDMNSRAKSWAHRILGISDVLRKRMLGNQRRCIELTHMPWPERLAMAKLIDTQPPDGNPTAPWDIGPAIAEYGYLRRLADGSRFGLADRLAAVARASTWRGCLRLAIAVERHERMHGELPGNVTSLIPQFIAAVPADPFDGQPLRYIRLDDGYVIYSVGRDGVDNGGAVEDGKDIGIRVQRPDLRAAQ
jgi:hypothetical protein